MLWFVACFGMFTVFFVVPVALTTNHDIVEGTAWFLMALTPAPAALATLTWFINPQNTTKRAFWIETSAGIFFLVTGLLVFFTLWAIYLTLDRDERQLRGNPLNRLVEKVIFLPLFGLMVIAMLVGEGIKGIPWMLRRLIPILAVAIGLYVMYLLKQAGEIQDIMMLNGRNVTLLAQYKELVNRCMWNGFAYLTSIVFILCFVFPGRAMLYTQLSQRTIVGGIVGFALGMAAVAGINYYFLHGGFYTLIHSLIMPVVFFGTGMLISWIFKGYGYWSPLGHQQR
jgi:hypothetical protein